MFSARAGKRRTIAEINVVPYIDVMLVLLIIFMVTAPMINQGVDVELPTASAKPLAQDTPLPIIVSVNMKGDLFLNISPAPQSPIQAQKLQSEVKAALARNPKRVVMVKADRRVTYSTVMDAMVLLQQAGVPNIGLETSNLTVSEGIGKS
jgi:biopolymer transport protein TolR